MLSEHCECNLHLFSEASSYLRHNRCPKLVGSAPCAVTKSDELRVALSKHLFLSLGPAGSLDTKDKHAIEEFELKKK